MQNQNKDAQTSSGEGATRLLSKFLTEARYDTMPFEVIERTKHLILDGLVCGLVAARVDWSTRAVETLRKLDGEGPASVWGWKLKLPPMSAALLNGTFVQGFELDDYHSFGPLHSEACVIPAVLGTAEQIGDVDGKRFLEGVVLGFEIGPRIGMAMGGLQLVTRGWHCGSVFGVLGAVAGAGKIRRLNEDQFEDAIGNAATQACGLMSAQFEAMVKRMHSGMSARSGILAAALADAGFTGIKRVIERDFGGFVATFCRGDPYDITRLTDRLGEWWETMRINVKPAYSSMGGTHTAVENALKLRALPEFSVDKIDKIRVGVVEAMQRHGGFKLERPAAPIGAQMSHRYVIAVTLIDGQPTVPQFAPQRINQDDVWKLMDRIDVYHDTEIEQRGEEGRWGTRLTVTFTDGSIKEIETRFPKGGAKFPLTNAEIVQKYDQLSALILDRGRADRLKETVLSLDKCRNIAALSDLLSQDVRAPF